MFATVVADGDAAVVCDLDDAGALHLTEDVSGLLVLRQLLGCLNQLLLQFANLRLGLRVRH